MKVFMLDVTRCEQPMLGGYSQLIPCRLGEHSHDLDVMEERLPDSVVKQWREESRIAHSDIAQWDESKPLGFNLEMMPIGATLTVVEEVQHVA